MAQATAEAAARTAAINLCLFLEPRPTRRGFFIRYTTTSTTTVLKDNEMNTASLRVSAEVTAFPVLTIFNNDHIVEGYELLAFDETQNIPNIGIGQKIIVDFLVFSAYPEVLQTLT